MRVIIQRVSEAAVGIGEDIVARIGPGMLVLLGIESDDGPGDVEWLTKKIVLLRIFDDADGVMNLPVTEINGDILVVSQFTLHAMVKKGNRPAYIRAARPGQAIPLYQSFIRQLEANMGKKVYSGKFGAEMQVSLVNDGPVTLFIDTKNKE